MVICSVIVAMEAALQYRYFEQLSVVMIWRASVTRLPSIKCRSMYI